MQAKNKRCKLCGQPTRNPKVKCPFCGEWVSATTMRGDKMRSHHCTGHVTSNLAEARSIIRYCKKYTVDQLLAFFKDARLEKRTSSYSGNESYQFVIGGTDITSVHSKDREDLYLHRQVARYLLKCRAKWPSDLR